MREIVEAVWPALATIGVRPIGRADIVTDDDCDNHCIAQMDSNDRPLCPERFVVTTVHPRHPVWWVRLHDSEMNYLNA